MAKGIDVRNVQWSPVIFPQLTQPMGFLPKDKEAQALWFYFCCAISNMKDEKEKIRMTTDGKSEESVFNYHGLYMSVAMLYASDPHKMQNYWPAVDMQATKMGLTKLPKEDKYRKPGALHAAVRPN